MLAFDLEDEEFEITHVPSKASQAVLVDYAHALLVFCVSKENVFQKFYFIFLLLINIFFLYFQISYKNNFLKIKKILF